MKPWTPPEARLYPVLDEVLEDWEADAAARTAEPGLRLVGHRFSAERTPRATSSPATASRTAGSTSPTTRRAAS